MMGDAEFVERTFELGGSFRIASKCWGQPRLDSNQLCVLACHGWMDNASSFDLLGPALVRELGAYIVAPDLPGHGRSSHLPPLCYYGSAEYAATVVELWRSQRWARGALVGHSMGTGISCLVAAALAGSACAPVRIESARSLSIVARGVSSMAAAAAVEAAARGAR